MCRFAHVRTRLNLPIDESINAAHNLWPSLVPSEEPGPLTEGTESHKSVTVAEIISGVWCDDPNCNGMVGEDNLHIGLGLGIQLIQRLQRSAHALTRQPYTLATHRSIPYLVPMAIGTVTPDRFEPPTQLGMWLVHDSVLSETPPEPVENLELLARLLPRVTSILFSDHLDLMRESTVAFRNRGDNRTAAILAGLSCERFLDDLLACLLWEDGVLPEDAVAIYKDAAGIVSRVRRSFHPRLSGWLADRGPVENWRVRVASVRNVVAHGNYVPTDEQIFLGGDAVVSLVAYCSSLLAQRARTGKYMRSAYALMSDSGIRTRGGWTPRVEQACAAYEAENQWTL